MSHLHVSYISSSWLIPAIGAHSGSLRRKSTQLTRNLAGSVGGYLPNTLTEMWDPQRDFAFLKLPTSGVRSVVALSR